MSKYFCLIRYEAQLKFKFDYDENNKIVIKKSSYLRLTRVRLHQNSFELNSIANQIKFKYIFMTLIIDMMFG